jgi:two-component system, NarL family, response regulator
MNSPPETAKQQIRVIIADDHPVVREGLAAILRSQEDIKIVAEATDGEETCELYNQLLPDVLMLDLRMPKKDGLQVLTELMSRRAPEPRIIVMTAYESEEDLRHASNAGAKGYLVKGANPQQIRAAIRTVAAGESLFPAEVSKRAESTSHSELSERELQVLQYIANGRSNMEIGQILYIAEDTVKGYVRSILTKLETMGRTEAIAIAARRGLIQAGSSQTNYS